MTDLALNAFIHEMDCIIRHTKWKKRDSQVPREVDIEPVLNSQVITQQLQRDDIQNTLQAIYSLRHADSLDVLGDSFVVFVAHDDGLGFPRGDLGEGRLYLGVQRVLRHDDNHGHVLVDQGEGAVLQFTSEDT